MGEISEALADTHVTVVAAPAASPAPRFAHLDGLRALASVYVVLFHAVIGFPRGELSGAWRLLKRAFAFGHEAVAIFIVLSGYCLMLPVVRRGGDTLPRSVGSFVARRAFRILPPYYAAVALSLLLIASVRVLGVAGSATIWDDSLPGFGSGPVLSHLVLVHNWFPQWAFQINGPFWSVATEWQIYFFFPCLLLPSWRRFGLVPCLAVAMLVGYAPLALLPASAKIAIPWYLALFALGMAAAAITYTPRAFERALKQRVNWAWLSFGAWLAALIGGWFFGKLWFRSKPLTDLWLGFATSAFLVYAASALEAGKRSRVLAWLGSPLMLALGHMSYSLYLSHLPVLALCHFALVGFGLSPAAHALALLGLGSVCSLLVARLFFLAVERHCMGGLPAWALRRRLGPHADSLATGSDVSLGRRE